jgi:hypothetical protein
MLAGSAFSAQPAICPDINDIQAEGLTMAEEIGPDLYISYNISPYNTPSMWGFIIAPVVGDSAEVAIDIANDILSTMTAPGVPEQDRNTLVCLYDTGRQDIYAAAINTDDGQISPMKLKQYFLKAH